MDVSELYRGIIKPEGGLVMPTGGGTVYFPRSPGVEYGYRADTGEYEAKRPGVAYASVPAPRMNALQAIEAAVVAPQQPTAQPAALTYSAASNPPPALTLPRPNPAMATAPRPAAKPRPMTREQLLQQYRQHYGKNVGLSLSGNIFLNDPSAPTGYRILGRVGQPMQPPPPTPPSSRAAPAPALSLTAS